MSLLVTLLTGARPNLLERTLWSVRENQPELLSAEWLVLHNGSDLETAEILRGNSDFLSSIRMTPELLDIGAATSLLFDLAGRTGHDHILHLEDDWEASPGPFLDRGLELLETSFQVRLRLATEKVLSRHMVTGKSLLWKPSAGARLSSDAHYTMNPSLMELGNLRFGFPALSENHAQRKFWRAGRRRVAQILPGVFSHIGGSESLRKR